MRLPQGSGSPRVRRRRRRPAELCRSSSDQQYWRHGQICPRQCGWPSPRSGLASRWRNRREGWRRRWWRPRRWRGDLSPLGSWSLTPNSGSQLIAGSRPFHCQSFPPPKLRLRLCQCQAQRPIQHLDGAEGHQRTGALRLRRMLVLGLKEPHPPRQHPSTVRSHRGDQLPPPMTPPPLLRPLQLRLRWPRRPQPRPAAGGTRPVRRDGPDRWQTRAGRIGVETGRQVAGPSEGSARGLV